MDDASEPGKIVVRCPRCAQSFHASRAHIGRKVVCPKCSEKFRIQPAAEPAGGLCPVCQSAVASDEGTKACPECTTIYHDGCWEYNGGCGVYGCAAVPATEQRDSLEIPAAHWGQEDKPCPRCGRIILAAAVRCRHCGATFASAAPEDAASFSARRTTESQLPAVQRTGTWLLVLALLPCAAPLVALFGSMWYLRHREAIEALPAIRGAICKIALLVAAAQSVIMLLAGVFYGAFGG